MANEVISYLEMCGREGTSLQRGMNFGRRDDHSVLLMSVRPGAPYQDCLEDDGTTLIYEGHDEPRSDAIPQPKAVDQPYRTAYGNLTQNGKFFQVAQDHKDGSRPLERVRVYEKLRQGIWFYNGVFHLVDLWQEDDGETGRCSSSSWRGQWRGPSKPSPRSPSRPEKDHPDVREAGGVAARRRELRRLRRDQRVALRPRLALLQGWHLDH